MNSEKKSLKKFVYDLLVENGHNAKNPLDQREIYQHCKDNGYDVKWHDSQNQHNDHCRWLTKLIDDINNDQSFDKILDHHGYRYYVCEREDALMLIQRRKSRICLAQCRITMLEKKLRRDGQGTCVPEGEFHETFLREGER